ncbi:MAG: hypothetical protein HUK26_03285 [Duodenibacillus sp.]|nr:hypothetical protein [Duodenibacillus sp.]
MLVRNVLLTMAVLAGAAAQAGEPAADAASVTVVTQIAVVQAAGGEDPAAGEIALLQESVRSGAFGIDVLQGLPQPSPGASRPLFWEHLGDEDKARLWPLMTLEQRRAIWRVTSREERARLRDAMNASERSSFKRRFVIDAGVLERGAGRPLKLMSDEGRALLRAQVREVHRALRDGVPYNCTDPTQCPRAGERARLPSLIYVRGAGE